MNVRLILLSLCTSLLALTNCARPFQIEEEVYNPPCAKDQQGTVCFHNGTDATLFLTIDRQQFSVPPSGSRCVECAVGKVVYQARQGNQNWENAITVSSCKAEYVELGKRAASSATR